MTLHFEVVETHGPRQLFAGLQPDKIAHGYLFTGPAGVGKRTFAHALARSLLCETPKDSVLGYCNTCSSCRLLTAGSHPDFFRHEGEIKIGDREGAKDEGLTARELVRALSLRGYGAARRVVILGEVDFATHHAANALLKFFEEPPGGVHLILTTSTVGKLLGTIRSRLVEVNFPPLSAQGVGQILSAEGVEQSAIARIVGASQGSVTRARSLLAGTGLREEVAGWFFAAVAGSTLESAWAVRATLEEALDLIALLIRDWLVSTVSQDQALLSGEPVRIRNLPKNPEAALSATAALQDARRIAATNVSPALVIEGLRLALAEAGKHR